MTQKLPALGDFAEFDVALRPGPRRDQTPPGTHGHRARLRERLLRVGPEALADHEMLEMILFTALPWRDTKPIALALIKRFGSYSNALRAPLADLLAIEEIGEAGAVALKLVQTAAARLVQTEQRYRPLLHNWDRLIEYLTSMLAHERIEQRRVLYLDPRNRLERVSTCLNRQGFPLVVISDSESLLVKEAGMDGPTTIDGSSSAAFGGD